MQEYSGAFQLAATNVVRDMVGCALQNNLDNSMLDMYVPLTRAR